MRFLLRALFPLCIFFFATGATECDSFNEVTIPARDNQAPTPFGGVHNYRGYEMISGEAFSYTASPDDRLVLVVGAIDAGGVFSMHSEITHTAYCGPYGIPFGSRFQRTLFQAGNIGDRVSNGMYDAVEFRRAVECPTTGNYPFPMQPMDSYQVRLEATIMDFHGNIVTTPDYSIWVSLP
jgi:hypothetical protein